MTEAVIAMSRLTDGRAMASEGMRDLFKQFRNNLEVQLRTLDHKDNTEETQKVTDSCAVVCPVLRYTCLYMFAYFKHSNTQTSG